MLFFRTIFYFRYLLGPALKMALANRNNFIPNPQENHLSCKLTSSDNQSTSVSDGLHGRVTLPLEMAILRAGDMASVDIITKAYAKQDKVTTDHLDLFSKYILSVL